MSQTEIITLKPPTRSDLSELSLRDLLTKAEAFGIVQVHSSIRRKMPNRYQVDIEFSSIKGTTLKAGSDFGMSIEEAFAQAIGRAAKIQDQFRSEKE